MSAEIIHIAGPVIYFGSVQRQRCAWCGALIEERDVSRMAVKVDPTASHEVQQEEANRALDLKWSGLVAVDGGMRWAVDDPSDGKAPERSCMQLFAEPNAEVDTGERVRVIGQPYRVLPAAHEAAVLAAAGERVPIGRMPGAPPPIVWVTAVFPNGDTRPIDTQRVVAVAPRRWTEEVT